MVFWARRKTAVNYSSSFSGKWVNKGRLFAGAGYSWASDTGGGTPFVWLEWSGLILAAVTGPVRNILAHMIVRQSRMTMYDAPRATAG